MKKFIAVLTGLFLMTSTSTVAQQTQQTLPQGSFQTDQATCPDGFTISKQSNQHVALQSYFERTYCIPNKEFNTQKKQNPVAKIAGLNAVVKLWISCNDEAPWTGAGSIVSKAGHILTAAHVGNKCIGEQPTVWVGPVTNAYEEPKKTWKAQLLFRQADGVSNPSEEQSGLASYQDIALFKITGNHSFEEYLKLSSSFPLPGDSIRLAGFSDFPFTYRKTYKPAPISIYKDNLVSVDAIDGRPARLHYVKTTLPGLSGGPVVSDKGELIGIHASMRNHETFVLNHYSWASAVASIPENWKMIIDDGNAN